MSKFRPIGRGFALGLHGVDDEMDTFIPMRIFRAVTHNQQFFVKAALSQPVEALCAM
jgi:hypothetical protein